MAYLFIVAIAAALCTALALWLTGWRSTKDHVDPYFFMTPQLPMVEPFSFDKAGAKKSIEFWVLPEEKTARTRVFFIGLRTVLAAGASDAANDAFFKKRDLLAYADMPVQIKLYKLDSPNAGQVELVEGYTVKGAEGPLSDSYATRPIVGDVATKRRPTDADNAALDKKGIPDDYTQGQRIKHLEFCATKFPTIPGRYRVDIEVLKDNPEIASETTELIISRYHPGK